MSERYHVIQICLGSFISALWFMTSIGFLKSGNVTRAGIDIGISTLWFILVVLHMKCVLRGDTNE